MLFFGPVGFSGPLSPPEAVLPGAGVPLLLTALTLLPDFAAVGLSFISVSMALVCFVTVELSFVFVSAEVETSFALVPAALVCFAALLSFALVGAVVFVFAAI